MKFIRTKFTKRVKRVSVAVASLLLCTTLTLTQVLGFYRDGESMQSASAEPTVKRIDSGDIDTSLEKYYDDSVVYRLSDTIEGDEEISVILSFEGDSLYETYSKQTKVSAAKTLSEFTGTSAGRSVASKIATESANLKTRIRTSGIKHSFGEDYNVLLGGFEVTILAKDYDRLIDVVGGKATAIVGEVYEKAESQIVENKVAVDEATGIFDSTDSDYDGSGTVIAVLDTGLDYTHSAFDPSRFEGDEVLTVSSLSSKVPTLTAATSSVGLTANDVYINKKVPYAYDYADKDPDVYPLQNEHGTHVSGVIVGNDDTIRGVSPNAQLVSMKVFSDKTEGAKTSWLLAALQDCVLLGVDIINMSLGTSCGFSNEQDEENVQKVYDDIKEMGISLVAAASNDYSSSFGSEKNGNLGLTSNPDTGTVGSPSTYAAALSVASVSGKKTPYLVFNNSIMYFTEASDQSSKPKDFVGELLGATTGEKDFEYITIPGVGRSADYTGISVRGKIALVKRGSTTFEEKIRIAEEKGAVGVIIYNNVSGKISMTVGKAKIPACSVSQDDGMKLAAQSSGTIHVSAAQVAGPFMSDFSSWGPTPALEIKPEITAHGGEILSAVPGQRYDRLSGTSMASPNQAGVTALVRQYVKEKFPELDALGVTARVNQLMMSTADVVKNTNNLPYAVRKQGAGLANLKNATSTPAYISTFGKDGKEMDKTKLELGDDPQKSGVYTMTFAVNNVSSERLTYNVGALVLTEGVSETLTVRGDTVVTEEGYLLSAGSTVTAVEGGSQNGNTVYVEPNSTAKVEVEIKLTDADKKYLDDSFANGMYVEGFITLDAASGTTIDLSVPYLAFYGDWNRAPIFDLEYFETEADEMNAGIDDDKKVKPDGYATRPLGGTYDDYIVSLGSYAFIQDPSATQVVPSRDHISLSNQEGEEGGVNNIYSVWAGMLRGADHIDITITDDTTGEVIYSDVQYNQSKSRHAGSTIYGSSVEFDFKMTDYDLKNNTRYTVFMKAYTPYGEDGGADTNLRNTFEFTFTTDFQAPALTGCEFYTEYDNTAKKNRLFAKLDIYDNHYSQAAAIGLVYNMNDENTPYYDPDSSSDADPNAVKYGLTTFERYLKPLYSSFNSTYTLTYELTDYLDEIKDYSYNNRSFVVQVMDYAQNTATYEITIPDEVSEILSFTDTAGKELGEEISMSVNEVFQINVKVLPDTDWAESVTLTSSDEKVLGIVNGKLIARSAGTATVTATANKNEAVKKQITVTVLDSGEGFVRYDKPVTDSFKLSEYVVDKAYYFVSTDDRELGLEGAIVKFTGNNYALSFFPSESVTVHYDLQAYFPDDTTVEFTSSNAAVVTVDKESGKITAVAEGTASVSVRVYMDGKSTFYSQTIPITVKNPYETNGFMLMSYKGLGGEVAIPDDLGTTEIYSYAFSNYEYIPKDENDEISKEDPGNTKISPIGENTITKVIVPEGVETIDSYAFAYLTALKEVVLPSTIKKIQASAFEGCTKLTKINLENVQFINQSAFLNCPIESLDLQSIVAIGNSAFEVENGVYDADGKLVSSKLKTLLLPDSAQSLGERAFCNNFNLDTVMFGAESVKLGSYVFAFCDSLRTVQVNASVIPSFSFLNCENLWQVKLGKDVSVIGQYAFAGTSVSEFTVDAQNPNIKAGRDGSSIVSADGKTLILVAPGVKIFAPSEQITTVGEGAFSGNSTLTEVNLPSVTEIGNYGFAECTELETLTLGTLTKIGDYAFFYCTKLASVPSFAAVREIGDFAFAMCPNIKDVEIADDTVIGDGAFMDSGLETATIGDDVTIGDGAFMAQLYRENKFSADKDNTVTEDGTTFYLYYNKIVSESKLTTVTIGNNAVIGESAFDGNMQLKTLTLGNNAEIGAGAFAACTSLSGALDLTSAKSVGSQAFSGIEIPVYAFTKQNPTPSDSPLGVYAYLYDCPGFTSVALDVEIIGADAFFGNTALTQVTLGENVKEIGAGAFYSCRSLTEINLGKVQIIGDMAFAGCEGLTSVDLGFASEIGAEAFRSCTALKTVKLADGVKVGDGAFHGDEVLSDINLGKIGEIGNYAFALCSALTKADLSAAVYVGEMAFASSGVTSVEFGDALVAVGDNPFYKCDISTFTDAEGNDTFEINDSLFVENGVLYSVAPNGGYILVSYPLKKADTVYTVKDKTVRIAAYAFAENTALVSLELPYTLVSIGDRAFYGDTALTLVVFQSVASPILEEQYDENYALFTNLPLTGSANGFEGLGIVPFYMWNYDMTSFYYGANFVDYVGKQTQTLIMVAPVNGENYDSFVMSKYFKSIVDGKVAPYQTTLDAIAAIEALPSYISLTDKEAVQNARAAYAKIALTEQQALVTNYSKLTSAENTIAYLEGQNKPDDNPKPQPVEEDDNTAVIVLAVLTGVFALVAAVFAVMFVLARKGYFSATKQEKTAAKPVAEPADEQPEQPAATEESVSTDATEEAIKKDASEEDDEKED